MSVWLPWLIRFDRDEGARVRALDFANNINFALVGSSTGAAVYAALEEQNIGVQFAALRYLQLHGQLPAIRHLRRLESDANQRIKDEVTSTVYAIRMRANAEREFRRVLRERPTLSETLFSAFGSGARHVSAATLMRFLEHTNPQLRLIAAAELQRRRELPLPAALQLVNDDSRLVRQKAFRLPCRP